MIELLVRRRDIRRDVARQRSLMLYSLAVQRLRENRVNMARIYIERGLKILARSRTRKPLYYRRWVCRKCRIPLVPGLTARVRIRSTKVYMLVVKKCLVCGWINRTAVSRKSTEAANPGN